jgi:phosphoribosylaminoimidazole (AIR) synthetase
MYRTFNMGMGMVIAVDKAHAQSITEWISDRLPGTAVVGSVTNDGHVVTHAIEGVEFSHY